MKKSIIPLMLMGLLSVGCSCFRLQWWSAAVEPATAVIQIAPQTETPTPGPAFASGLPPAPTATPTSPSSAAALDCPVLPAGGFLTIWQSSPELQAALNCPTSFHPRTVPDAWEVATAYQPFERGAMIWTDHFGWYAQPGVFVLHADSTYQYLADTFDPAVDSIGGDETPPDGLVEPLYGFGKVWREQPGVRESLGWATSDKTSGVGRFQMFVGGNMVWISQTNQTYVFSRDVAHVFEIPFAEEP